VAPHETVDRRFMAEPCWLLQEHSPLLSIIPNEPEKIQEVLRSAFTSDLAA